jgi:hypothetical protein
MGTTFLFVVAFLFVQESTPIFQATGSFAEQETPKDDPFKGLDFYVVKFTSPTCRYCDYGDKTGKLAELKQSVYVEVIDVDQEQNVHWLNNRRIKNPNGRMEEHLGVNRLPSYWLVRRHDAWPIKKWIGNIDHRLIHEELKTQKSTTKPTVKPTGEIQLFGFISTTHESRETLIRHLLYEEPHKGKHQALALSKMSDMELDQLHKNDH